MHTMKAAFLGLSLEGRPQAGFHQGRGYYITEKKHKY